MEKEIYRHYGNNKYDKGKFVKIHNEPFCNKPYGGLWACPTKDVDYTWLDWCKNEEFHLDRLNKHFDFTLKDNAKVYVVKSIKDLDPLPKTDTNENSLWVNLDFEKIAKEYDAMQVYLYRDREPKEDYYTTLLSNPTLYYKLYGWDVDSIVVFNPDVIEEVA